MQSIAAYAEADAIPASEPQRLARLLDLAVAGDFDDVALANRVTEGLPVGSLAALLGFVGQPAIMAPVVPEPTLRRIRKAQKPLSREHSERVYELSRVVDAVSRAFHGDAASVRAFLTRPHPLLDRATPIGLAQSSSAGAAAVLNLIHRAEASVAV